MSGLSRLLPDDYPRFWHRRGWLAWLLWPLTLLYAGGGALRRWRTDPVRVDVPVVCVGNLTVGGTGKTPVVLALARALMARGVAVHLIGHGYRGARTRTVRVDAETPVTDVGDEALLLAREAPTWVAPSRLDAVRAARQAGAELILLDDGWQDPSILKDRVIAVVDAAHPFGNGLLFPAGPLRQHPETLDQADWVVAVGASPAPELKGREVLAARRKGRWGRGVESLQDKPAVVALCGLGRSSQFVETVQTLCAEDGLEYAGAKLFPDHHHWQEGDLDDSVAGRVMVTTAKDDVRLPSAWRSRVVVVELELEWQDAEAWQTLVEELEILVRRPAPSPGRPATVVQKQRGGRSE